MFALFIFLGILPSLIWLSIYLREDDHPEPNRMILQAFLVGALAAPIAGAIELLFLRVFELAELSGVVIQIVIFFGVVGFVEEFWKYYVLRLSVLKNRSFDEPTDAMIYLIVAALGFAALENIFALFSFVDIGTDAIEITLLRFVSATLLHVLASAIMGYYVAEQYFFFRSGRIVRGLIIASVLHGLYNILTVASEGFREISATIYVVTLLGLMAIAVNILFYKLKRKWQSAHF